MLDELVWKDLLKVALRVIRKVLERKRENVVVCFSLIYDEGGRYADLFHFMAKVLGIGTSL